MATAGSTLAQDFTWARAVGGVGRDYAYAVAADKGGAVVAGGSFSGTADFDPGPGTASLTAVKTDGWVAKLDAAGALVWARQLAGSEDADVLAIATDAADNVYLAGWFSGVADFDPGPGTFNLGTNTQTSKLFVWKLSSGGDLVWARAVGDTTASTLSGYALVLDGGGNVLVTGSFTSIADFDPGPGTSFLTSAGLDDVFVLKLEGGGDFVWAKRIGGNSFDIAYGLAVDATDRVAVAGTFFNTVDFDPGPGVFNLASSRQDAFVLVLDGAGGFAWAGRIGGDDNDVALDVGAAAGGDWVVFGNFQSTADLDPGGGSVPATSHGVDDAFVVKLNAGGAFVWGGAFGGSFGDRVGGLGIGPAGNIYLTGEFSDTVDFDPGPGLFSLFSKGFSRDVFVLKLDPDGAFAWAVQLGGSGNEEGTAVAVAGNDQVLTAGYFGDTGDYDPGVGTFSLAPAGMDDAFLSRLTDAFAVPVVRHVPADFATIQEAIDGSRHRDTILVAPGTYGENIDFHGQHVVLKSEQGPAATILDGGGHGPVVTLQTGEDQTTVLEGFTIRNGLAGPPLYEGGGVLIQGFASPTVRGNLITQNVACGAGCGMMLRTGSAVVERNEIRGNSREAGCTGGVGGGGIAVLPARDSSPIIQDNVIADNSYGGGGFGGGGISVSGLSDGITVIARNRIFGNSATQGGGITIQGTPALIVNNLLYDNHADNGGGLYVASSVALVNNTVADNAGTTGSALLLNGPGAVAIDNNILQAPAGGGSPVHCGAMTSTPPAFHSNDVYSSTAPAYAGVCSNPFGTNVSGDPLFIDAASRDYRLWPASPAVDHGDNTRVPPGFALDIDGGTRFLDEPDAPNTGVGSTPFVDLGAYEMGRGADFFTVAPCRVLDTRAGSPLQSGVPLSVLLADHCGVPRTARAVAVNVTVAGATGAGSLTLFAGDGVAPGTSTINFKDANALANNAVLSLARNGAGTLGAKASIAGGGSVDLILDVFGYFQE